MTLLELAERCEAATGPDDTIDYVIARLRDANGKVLKQEYYTSSIEAAMTLVPNGCGVKMAFTAHENWVQIATDTAAIANAKAATPALAICGAALRARAAQGMPSKGPRREGGSGASQHRQARSVRMRPAPRPVQQQEDKV